MIPFKTVSLYCSYAEYSIECSPAIRRAVSLQDAVDTLYNENVDWIKSTVEKDQQHYYLDFINKAESAYEDLGGVCTSEETATVILSPSNPWYDKIDSYENWDESTTEAWREYIENSKIW